MAKSRYSIRATCYDKRGRVISTGTNSYTKTHPVQAHFARKVGLKEKQYLHAEIEALLRAGSRKVHKIMIENTDGRQGSTAPCPICMEAIRAWGVKKIEHTV